MATIEKPTQPTLESLKDFLDYLYLIGSESITESQLEELYNEEVYIEFNNHVITARFDAPLYNSLVSLVETLIKEY
jgi:hypothetical protein